MIKNSSPRRVSIVPGLFFCLALVWCVFLFQGMPASDLDDWYKTLTARQIPWDTYLSTFFRPWSLNPHWDGQTDALDGIHTKRVLSAILLKLSQQFFGLSPFAMYFLTKGIFFAGCVSIIFLLLIEVVPWPYAVLGTLVFLFVPAHYLHALWIADAATLCYFFLFLGALIFHTIQKNIREEGSQKQFAWLLLTLFAAGWTGIKAKESMLALPLIAFIYSLISFRSWRQAPFKWFLLNAAMAFVAFQIVPITNLNSGAFPSAHFNLGTITRLFFRNYDCGYDNEAVSAFFSWEHVFPVSVARTLGFFLLWAIVISLGFLGWRKGILKNKFAVSFWDHSLIRICTIWLLVEMPFLGMFQADPRYFSGTMAPIIVLLTRLAYCAIKEGGKFWGLGLLLLWVVSAGFSVYENSQNIISLRLNLGRKFNYLLESARMVLEDLKNQKVSDNLEVGKFYAGIQNNQIEAPIKNHVFYADLGISYDGWNRVPLGQNTFDNFKLYSKNGYKYYITVENLDLSGNTEIRQIGTVDGMNRCSLLERILSKKKKKRPAILRIYKHE